MLRCRFQFTNRSQEVLDSCAHDETRAPSILRRDRDERAVISSSGDLKYSAPADSLELRWTHPSAFNHDLLVVEVEQYVMCVRHLLLCVFCSIDRRGGAVKRTLINATLGPRHLNLCPRCRIAEHKIERFKTLIIGSIIVVDFCVSQENVLVEGT